MIVDELKQKYQKEFNKANFKEKSHFNVDVMLFQKFHHKISKGHYGFSLGGNTPFFIFNILEEFILWLEVQDPKFKIQQVKFKFSFLRFYCSFSKRLSKKKIDMIRIEISKLEEWIHHPGLMY